MSSLSQAHESERPELPEGAQPLEIAAPSTDLRNAKTRAEAREIMEAIATKENLKKSSKGRYEDATHPAVILYIETMNRLRKQEVAEAPKAKAPESAPHEAKKTVNEVREKATQAVSPKQTMISSDEYHALGLLADQNQPLPDSQLIAEAKKLPEEEKIKALEGISKILLEKDNEKKLQAKKRAEEKERQLEGRIQTLIQDIERETDYPYLKNRLMADVAKENLVFQKGNDYFKNPKIKGSDKLCKAYEARKKLLVDMIRDFDEKTKGPDWVTFTEKVVENGRSFFDKYGVNFKIIGGGTHVLIEGIIADNPGADNIPFQANHLYTPKTVPVPLRGSAFRLEGGKIVATNTPKASAKPDEAKLEQEKAA